MEYTKINGGICAAKGFKAASCEANIKYSNRTDMAMIYSEAGRLQVFDKGTPIVFDEDEAIKILQAKEVTVFVDMHEGNEEATAWGCDLTYDYVKINADYRS